MNTHVVNLYDMSKFDIPPPPRGFVNSSCEESDESFFYFIHGYNSANFSPL